jgi:hypothetical protein
MSLVCFVTQVLSTLRDSVPGARKKHPNLPRCACADRPAAAPSGLPAISVAHYGEQNGDLMRDPEMCFELGFAEAPHLDPFYFRNDYLGIEEWSRTIERGHYVHLSGLHEQHKQFARQWDNNLRLQGFAEAFERQQTPRA